MSSRCLPGEEEAILLGSFYLRGGVLLAAASPTTREVPTSGSFMLRGFELSLLFCRFIDGGRVYVWERDVCVVHDYLALLFSTLSLSLSLRAACGRYFSLWASACMGLDGIGTENSDSDFR